MLDTDRNAGSAYFFWATCSFWLLALVCTSQISAVQRTTPRSPSNGIAVFCDMASGCRREIGRFAVLVSGCAQVPQSPKLSAVDLSFDASQNIYSNGQAAVRASAFGTMPVSVTFVDVYVHIYNASEPHPARQADGVPRHRER